MTEPGTRTVLVADDDVGHRTVVDMLLSVDGYEVVQVGDGREALAWLKDHTPDLAILDVSMPYVDGIDVCSRMRRVTRLARVPVIVLTGMRDDRTRDLARLAKADAMVTKPLVGKEFRELIRSVLEGRRQPI